MFEITMRGLINLLNFGWHVEVKKPSEEDKRERHSPSMTLYYSDKDSGQPSSITLTRKTDG